MVKYRNTGTDMFYTAQSTGGAVVDISNTGMTLITSTVASERYVLAPPVRGCIKQIVFAAAAGSTGRLIELSSVSSGDSVTIVPTSGGTGTATEIIFESTLGGMVTLVGLATTQWMLVQSAFGLASTGIVLQAS